MDVGHITGESRSDGRTWLTNKSLLNEHHLWLKPKYIGLEGSELVKRGHATSIPGQNMKRSPTSEHCGKYKVGSEQGGSREAGNQAVTMMRP